MWGEAERVEDELACWLLVDDDEDEPVEQVLEVDAVDEAEAVEEADEDELDTFMIASLCSLVILPNKSITKKPENITQPYSLIHN